MLNLVFSDLYRVKKGTFLYGVAMGLLALFLLLAVIFKVISSPIFNELMESSADGTVITIESDSVSQDLAEMQEELDEFIPDNGGAFGLSMLTEASNCLPLFLLPLLIAVFGADYSAGTFRNSLSYLSKRTPIYLSKLLISILLTIVIVLVYIIGSVLIGSLFFGFGGLGAAFWKQTLIIAALQFPINLAFICLGHCIMAVSRKTSHTIAIYLVGLLVWSVILQLISMTIPGAQWLMNFDLMNAMTVMANYQSYTRADIIMPQVFSLAVIAASLGIGVYRYQKTDFDFN